MRRSRGFCGCSMLFAGLLVGVLLVALFHADLFKPSSPPMQVKMELEAWNAAVGFVRGEMDNPPSVQFPLYSPVFVRKTGEDTWEIASTVDLLDTEGVRTARKAFRVVEKWDAAAGWTLLEISVTP